MIKFFGSLACHDPKEICEKHRTFLKTTFDLLATEDTVLLGVVVDTIGIIATSLEGKFALNKQGKSRGKVWGPLTVNACTFQAHLSGN